MTQADAPRTDGKPIDAGPIDAGLTPRAYPAPGGDASLRSPEARRRQALRESAGLQERIEHHVGPGSHAFIVVKRVVTGVWQDGFIHAGNLAYMAILSLFPFFIVVAALFSAVGAQTERGASVHAFLGALPPIVSQALEPVARSVIDARHGWLLWAGGAVGLWTVSSLIETIRDILHRAYGTPATQAFWQYRLLSTGMTVLTVVLLLASLYAQVAISAAQELVLTHYHRLASIMSPLRFSRILPMAVLFGSIYLLFLSLTPMAYRRRTYPKWPGALLVAVWWGVVSIALPVLLRFLFKYDLTYGSLAGVMISLFFFWLVGLGMVTGAELNAALAETPEERDMIGQADNRARKRN